MKKLLALLLLSPLFRKAQLSLSAYQSYDIRATDKIIFEDDFPTTEMENFLLI